MQQASPPPQPGNAATAAELARIDSELAHLNRIANVLDQALRIPGTRIGIGLDAVIGLIPVAGDLFSAGLSTWLIVRAARIGAPRPLLARMLANMGIDALLGAVPLLGDLFDIGWRANSRNLGLLQVHLQAERQRLLPVSEKPQAGGLLRLALVALSLLLLALGAGSVLWLATQPTPF